VHAEVEAFEKQHGIELDDESYGRMVQLGHVYSIPPEQAYAETAEGTDEEEFADLVGRIAESENRELTRSEIERLAELDEKASLTGETELDISEAVFDLDSSSGREHYIAERLEIPQEREAPSADVIGEDGEVKPGFNLDNSTERAAAIDNLLEGQDVTGYDSTYETETD
jgi:hypothetical protein